MRFAVPQFIDLEDQIFGSLTFKQAIYLAGAGGVTIALYTRLGFLWTIFLATPIVALAVALAFFKVNEQPFMEVLYAWFFYMLHKKLYLWKKEKPKQDSVEVADAMRVFTPKPITPKLSQSRLKELAWSLDTQESMYSRKDQWK